jgi:hypothetical protein
VSENTFNELPAVMSSKRPAPIVSSGSEMRRGSPTEKPTAAFSNKEREKEDEDEPG